MCRYNWHSSGSPGWPFPVLKYKYKYIFQAKYTEKQFYQTALGSCYGLKLPKCWLQFKKNKFIVLFIIIFRPLSLPAGKSCDRDNDCDCGQRRTMNHIVDTCLLTEFEVGLNLLHKVEPTRSTQPCISPGSLNRVPASAGVRAVMSPLPGAWQVTL